MAFSDPYKNLDRFGLHEGQYVADLGAGAGHYTLEASAMVGEGGKVYAVDVQQDLLKRFRNALLEKHISNVELIHADIEVPGGTKIASNHIDAALVCNVLFQIEHTSEFIEEVKRILKPGGRALVIDWTDSFGGLGPQKDQVVSASQAEEVFTAQGFEKISGFEAGDHHYGLIFRKP